METQDNQLKALAERYRTGQCTSEEFKQIREWYDSFEENGYPLPIEAEVRRASDEAVMHVMYRIAKQQKRARIKKLLIPVLKIAAILILISSAGLLIFSGMHQPKQALAWQQVSALAGEKNRSP